MYSGTKLVENCFQTVSEFTDVEFDWLKCDFLRKNMI